jgi:cytochrome P450
MTLSTLRLSTFEDLLHQYEWFHQMRETQPVWFEEATGCWHVFRYEEVREVISNSTHFSSRERAAPNTPFANSIATVDPPEHRKFRSLLAPSFTPRALERRLAEHVRVLTQQLLDQVWMQGHLDLVNDLTYPLPAIVIAELLGVPVADRPQFRRWADALVAAQLIDDEQALAEEERLRALKALMREMTAYFVHQIEAHRDLRQPDLLSKMLDAQEDGMRFSQEEILSFCRFLLIAGHMSTSNLLALAILALNEYPEVRAQFASHPDLIPGTIEEVLRYYPVNRRVPRTTTTEVTLGGVCIPAERTVIAWTASANRDEAQFPDPDRFDITRSPNCHLAFGHGVHACIGAPLARLEASIALPMILEQLPGLTVTGPVELLGLHTLLGVKHLPVTLVSEAQSDQVSARASH